MADAAQRAEWERWSIALCMFKNANRPKGTPPSKPSTFNPYSTPRKSERPKLTKEMLQSVLAQDKR